MPSHEQSAAIEEERESFYSSAFEVCRPVPFNVEISTHALLLGADVRIAFRAGAWLSVIALAFAAVEAQFRQVFRDDYESRASKLFGSSEDLRWLRELRNEVLHAGQPGTKSDLWKASPSNLRACHAALEPEARRAITVMFQSIYRRRAG
jgi:hypothetical protein